MPRAKSGLLQICNEVLYKFIYRLFGIIIAILMYQTSKK